MREFVLSACVFLVAVAAPAPAGVLAPPQQPILATTDIGEVPLEAGRLRVRVAATLTTNQVSASVWLEKDTPPVRVLTLDPQEIPPMLKVIEDAAVAASAEKDFAGAAGRLTIRFRGGAASNPLVLEVRTPKGGPERFSLDSSGATQFARVLAQSKAVADWLVAKLKTIQPEMLVR